MIPRSPVPAMHPHEQLIRRFYAAFQRRDAAAMGTCYHDQAVFEDPAFGELDAEAARAMWAMLCARATDLAVACDGVRADDRTGTARWHADYTFGQTGRKVNNRIQAEFEFRDGLIVGHRDHFSFWRWARQALGPVGWLLGWTPILRSKVRANALRGLAAYRAKAAG
jgi:ketosteroid isomerase-like protein